MAYKALYRQFRPRTFSEISGQNSIVSVLQNQVRTGNPAHAYVFAGQRGTGKTTAARILAMALNCKDPHDGDPCLKCENCLDALNDNMIDIVEIDAASNNGVDSARDIREKINLLPAAGKYKIYIIDEAHMLTNAAFNALLKTLEEPPEYAVFILATTELRKLPVTVLSRCQRFDFKSITEKEIVARLKEVCKGIGRECEEDALLEIARASGGAMRDALTILETCTAREGIVDIGKVSEALNLASRDSLLKLVRALDNFDAKTALTTLSDAIEGGALPAQLIGQLLQFYRDRLINGYISGKTDKESAKEDIRRIDVLSETENKLKNAGRSALMTELAIMKILLPEESESNADARILKLERRFDELSKMKFVPADSAEAGEKPKSDKKQAKTEAAPAVKNSESAEDAEALWDGIKKYVETEDPMLYPLIKTIYAKRLEGSMLYLASTHQSALRNLVAGVDQMRSLSEYAEKAAGRKILFDMEEEKLKITDDELPVGEMPVEEDENLV